MRLFVVSEHCKSRVHCVSGDTIIDTNNGLSHISEVKSKFINNTQNISITGGVILQGTEPVIRIETKLGYSIDCTKNHKVLIFSYATNNLEWTEAGELVSGQYIVMKRGYSCGGNDIITEEEAELLGNIDGDGWITGKTVGLLVEKTAIELIEKYSQAFYAATGNKLFKDEIPQSKKVYRLRSSKKGSIEWARKWGLKRKTNISKEIMSLSPKLRCAYLRGLFEADGSVSTRETKNGHLSSLVSLASSSKTFIKDVQQMLFSVGIISILSESPSKSTNYAKKRELFILRILGGANLDRFIDDISFNSRRKSNLLHRPVDKYTKNDTFPIGFYNIKSFPILKEVLHKHSEKEDYLKLKSWIHDELYFAPVSGIKQVGKKDVYDVLDSPTESFIANGFIVHNCSTCRNLDDGRWWRNDIGTRYELPDNSVDFNCPYGIEWGYKTKETIANVATTKTIKHRSQPQINVKTITPVEVKSSGCGCSRKKNA